MELDVTESGAFECDWIPLNERRADRLAALKEGKVEPFYIVAYGISRHYGGPEEGGWWYDCTRILEVRKCWDVRQGLKAARALRDEYPTCRYGRGSVLGGEDVYVHAFHTPDYFPSENSGSPGYC